MTFKGAQGTPPPSGVEFSLISCSFQEILIKSYMGAPRGLAPILGEILDPPLVLSPNIWNKASVTRTQKGILTYTSYILYK